MADQALATAEASSTKNSKRAVVIDVQKLETQFVLAGGTAKAVNEVSFNIKEGETLCVVGESGSGKSVTALTIMRLLTSPPARIAGGQVIFKDRNLLELSEQEMQRIRGNDISMIFQEPMTSLNPVLSCGYQIAEVVRRHQGLSKNAAWARAIEMLHLVRIPEAERRAKEYPHQLSGGMRQRVMIAIALSCNPKLIIADEPTTALDVTIQAQILQLIDDLRTQFNTAVMLITHDLGVVAETANHVMVMYAGSKVEEAPVKNLFKNPRHPYTFGLMRSVPKIGASAQSDDDQADLIEIPGIVPPLTDLPTGCAFAPRCMLADENCQQISPPYLEQAPGHWSACWHSDRVNEAIAT